MSVPSVDAPHDLPPGASVTFSLPGIDATTARTTNRLAVDLRVLDDPSWLAAYLPVSAMRSGSVLGPLMHPDVAQAGGVPGAGALPAAEPSPTPAVTPTTSPSPAATAAPTVTPSPSPSATPAPTPRPTPKPSAAPPAAHVTRTYSEHSRSIVYRGGWDDAGMHEYLGGNVAWSTTPGATATLTFTGTSVTWIGPLGPTRGRALVLVDGRAVARINLWRSTFIPRAVIFRKTLRGGRHTLTIKVLASPGHPYVAIDGFTVRS